MFEMYILSPVRAIFFFHLVHFALTGINLLVGVTLGSLTPVACL